MENNIVNIINFLIKNIKKLDYNYYIKNISLISNKKYDLLLNKLYTLKSKYPSFFIKYKFIDNINLYIKNKNKIYHICNMLSIKNTYNINDIIKYNNDNNKIEQKNIKYCCELKIDGIAVNLLYKNGILIESSTRGNGIIGENIFNNINYIYGIPKYINDINFPDLIEIRGEIYIDKYDLIDLNNENINKKFVNERNAASALVRKKNLQKYKKKYLKFIPYGIGYINYNYLQKYKLCTQSDILLFLKKYNFSKYSYKFIIFNSKKINLIFKYIKYIEKIRNKIPFVIDGIVIKVNNINVQNLLNENNRYPKWMIAYKFCIHNILTKILNIKFNINNNGLLLPIAEINPIIKNGIIIKNINLFNTKYIIKNKINVNDEIKINIVNDTIPKIIKIFKKNNNLFKFPKDCISCKKKLLNYNDLYICNNYYYMCKYKYKSFIKRFISHNAFNIKNIGNSVIDKLINNNKIKNIYYIFNLNIIDLINIDIKRKDSIKIIKNIINSKNIKFENFIFSLNIPTVNINNSIKISNIFFDIFDLINNFNNIIKLSSEDNKISKKCYYELCVFLNNKENINNIIELVNNNINIIYKRNKIN